MRIREAELRDAAAMARVSVDSYRWYTDIYSHRSDNNELDS